MTHLVLHGENEFSRRQQQKTSSRNQKFLGKFVNLQFERTFILEKKNSKKNFLEKVILTKISAGEISVCTIAEMRLFRILL